MTCTRAPVFTIEGIKLYGILHILLTVLVITLKLNARLERYRGIKSLSSIYVFCSGLINRTLD